MNDETQTDMETLPVVVAPTIVPPEGTPVAIEATEVLGYVQEGEGEVATTGDVETPVAV